MAKNKLRKRARRDVRAANRFYLNEIENQEAEAKDQLQEDQNRVNNIYDALVSELSGINFNQNAQPIADQFSANIAGLAGLLGTSTPAGEQAAAAGLLGNIGGGGLSLLASDAQRNVAYNSSTKRQAGVERATLRRNYLEDYRDFIDSLQDAKLDLKADMGLQFQARLDELRDQRFQRRLMDRELDVAEQQFNKTFGLQQKQYRDTKKRENVAADFFVSEAERERIQKIRKRQIKPRRAEIKDINQQLEDLGTDAISYNAQAPGLIEQRKTLQQQINKQKRRIRKIRRD